MGKQVFNGVPMRVEEKHPMAIEDILQNEAFEHGGLAAALDAKDVEAGAPLYVGYGEILACRCVCAEGDIIAFVIGHAAFPGTGTALNDPWSEENTLPL